MQPHLLSPTPPFPSPPFPSPSPFPLLPSLLFSPLPSPPRLSPTLLPESSWAGFGGTGQLLQVTCVYFLWPWLPLSRWLCLLLEEVTTGGVAKEAASLKVEPCEDILLFIPARPCFLSSLITKDPCQERKNYKHFCHQSAGGYVYPSK